MWQWFDSTALRLSARLVSDRAGAAHLVNMKTLEDLRLPAPRDLDAPAERLWRHGDDTGGITGRRETIGDPPVPGDLWITSAGEDDFGPIDLALVLVTRVVEDGRYVLGVPVTTRDEPTGAGALLLSINPLGVPLVVWAHLETGIAFETLTRRLGQTTDVSTLSRLRRYGNGDGPAPLPVVPVTDEQAAEEFVSDLTQRMAVACYADTDQETAA